MLSFSIAIWLFQAGMWGVGCCLPPPLALWELGGGWLGGWLRFASLKRSPPMVPSQQKKGGVGALFSSEKRSKPHALHPIWMYADRARALAHMLAGMRALVI